MSFLPDNYEVPVETNYMKFIPGQNKLRILDSAIVGQVFWVTTKDGRKPIRKHQDEKISPSELDMDSVVKHFWAFPVYNYQAKRVQILEITQKTIMNAINALVRSEDWGDPKEYDILVTKDGEGKDTEYHVMPSPKKPTDPGVVKFYEDMDIKLDRLYSGEDPFAPDSKKEMKEAADEVFGK